MFPSKLTLLCLFILYGSVARALNSRSVVRSAKAGAVNLVEFNVKGTTFGRCSFRYNGEYITLVFQETDQKLKAVSNNPTVVDAVSKVATCKHLATQSPEQSNDFRSDLGETTSESELELFNRIKEYEAFLLENQETLNNLDPKFFSALLSGFLRLTNLSGYGLQFGSGSSPLFPGVNFGSPSTNSGSIFKWFGRRR